MAANNNPNAAQQALLQRVRNDRIFLNNPVMFQGLGLAPLVVADTSLRNALILSVAIFLLVVPTRLLTVLLLQFTGNRGHTVLYPLVASAVYVPAYLLLQAFFGTYLLPLGIYLAILVVEPLVISRAERARLEEPVMALKQGTSTATGAAIVMLLMGGIRELLATGSLYGYPVWQGSTNLMPLAAHPAGGFILLGLVCALWRAAANRRKKHLSMEAVWKQ